MLFKILFEIGKRLRNPSLNKQFLFLKSSEKWSLKELEHYQLQALKELLQCASEHSKYYKQLFEKEGIDVSEIKSLDDIKTIPILLKNDLIRYNKEIHTTTPFKKVFKSNTSGTSGESLKFFRNEKADSFNRASIFRGYSWYQVKPWEYNGYFWGYNFNFWSKLKTICLDFLQNRFRIFSYQEVELEKFARKLKKAVYIHGYSSMIYELSKYINKKGWSNKFQLKMIKGTSEKIFDGYQDEIKKAFGKKMISEYGATETGIIAFECPKGNMHINMEGVLVEQLDNEIVVTNLQMHSFPIIRYKLGDYIKLNNSIKCTCGMAHPVLEEVTGRVGNTVYGNKLTYPSLYFYYVFKNISKENKLQLTHQIKQEEKGKLIVNIEEKLNKEQIEMVLNEFKKYFESDISIVINTEAFIQKENGKLKSFISKL